MDKDNTISLQEVRKDPVGFLQKINAGKTLTVIYHSKPLATVTSAHADSQQLQGTKQLLELAARARASAQKPLDTSKSYKQLYHEDMAKKYGIS